MVVKVGDVGSICFYWGDLYLSSIAVFDDHQKTYDRYMLYYNRMLIKELKTQKRNIKDIIRFCLVGLDTYKKRKELKKRMDLHDHIAIQMMIFMLLKMELLDFDDVIYFTGRKKISKTSKH
jgi:hypothetical protein